MSYIKAESLTVEFPLFNNAHRSIKNTVLNMTTGGRLAKSAGKTVGIRALDSLDFEIKNGDRIGLVGHNGSGKTTLLRVLTGAYEPTFGALYLKGRVSSLLDINLGIDQDASGYENIFLRGIMMGMTPIEIRQKTNGIAEFTELGEFLHMPVRTYSSGMKLRLAFAISTSIEADIILMDEWLSVGDTHFKAKASERMQKFINNSAILVLASHDLNLINKICNRVFHMEHGFIVKESQCPAY